MLFVGIFLEGKHMTHIKITIFLTLLSLLSCATRQPGEMVTMDPEKKKAELYYDYGTNALVKQDYTKALVNLKKAVEIISDDSRYHNNLGMAYFFKGDTNSAVKHLETSIDLDNKNSDAKNNLASVYYSQKKFKKAQDLYVAITKDLEYNKQFRVYYNLGLLALQGKRLNLATQYFKKSIKDNMSYCPTQFQLGQLAFQAANYQQANIYYENASLGTCEKDPTPMFSHAVSLMKLGEYDKAALKFEEVVEKFPESKLAVQSKRKIEFIKVNKLRDDETQALKYQVNKLREKIRKEKDQAKNNETAKPVDSPKF